jgi:hypothetical protein
MFNFPFSYRQVGGDGFIMMPIGDGDVLGLLGEPMSGEDVWVSWRAP